jgi:hypothetical protein
MPYFVAGRWPLKLAVSSENPRHELIFAVLE